jgi:Cytochrome P450
VMIMHPGILEKAQAEIDSVIGPDRLPDIDDRKSLPYLGCIVNELYR